MRVLRPRTCKRSDTTCVIGAAEPKAQLSRSAPCAPASSTTMVPNRPRRGRPPKSVLTQPADRSAKKRRQKAKPKAPPGLAGWQERQAAFGVNLGISAAVTLAESRKRVGLWSMYSALALACDAYTPRARSRAATIFLLELHRTPITQSFDTCAQARLVHQAAQISRNHFYREVRELCGLFVFAANDFQQGICAGIAYADNLFPVVDPPLCPLPAVASQALAPWLVSAD